MDSALQNQVQAHVTRGQSLRDVGRPDEAMQAYDAALALQPDSVPALVGRGVLLRGMGRNAEAVLAYDAALAINPGSALIHSNRANALHDLVRYDEALAAYDAGLAIKPDFADLWCNRATTLLELRRLDEAEDSCRRAIQLDSQSVNGFMSLNLIMLLRGKIEEGLARPGWRRFIAEGQGRMRGMTPALWYGQDPLQGRTLLLHNDQGLGDAIQFCRYADLLAARGARVVLETPRPLLRLMASLRGPAQLVAFGDPLPAFDLRCPVSAAPFALGEIAPAPQPYLAAPEADQRIWAERLGPRTRPRVGIAWSGSQVIKTNTSRFLPLDALLGAIPPEVEAVPIQPGLDPADAARLDAAGIRRADLQITDFASTAGLMSQLDLVISPDTSAIHLAGALGVSGRMLALFTPDWRWFLDREDSPWYPSLRLLRQTRPGDWSGPLQDLRRELEALTGQAE